MGKQSVHPGDSSKFCLETLSLNVIGITVLLIDIFCLDLMDNIVTYRPLSLVDSNSLMTHPISHFEQDD